MKAAAIPGAIVGRSPIVRFRARLRLPLYRNGYALVASSGLTSALGIVYWLVAARLYSPVAVGVSAALISAMTLLANLAQLNLKSALNRFLPRAGGTAKRFVTRSYAVVLGVSAVAGLIFLAGLGLWSPRLRFVSERPELALWFVASTMAWTIFVLQDSVLAGIRQAGWVPVENLFYAVAKIALLVGVAAIAPTLGTFVAWTAPLLALVIPVNLLLFRRLIPRHVRTTRGQEQAVATRQIARYVAADYAAYLVLTATIGVLPLIVLGVLGPEANAYYFVSWSIAYALYLIASGMGMSMIAEASLDPAMLRAHSRRTILETARLTVPAVAVVVVAAPQILGLLGGDYSRESVGLLRLLALSALPWIVFVTYTNVARVQRRMRAVIGAHVALASLVLAFGIPFLGTLGIEGLGVAWLAAQSTVAIVIIAARAWHARRRGWREHALPALSSARIWAVHVCRIVGGARARRGILEALRRSGPHRSDWRLQGHLRTRNDVAVSRLGTAGAAPVALLKLATSAAAERSLRLQHETLLRLRSTPGLERWSRLVPQVLSSGRAEDRRFVVEGFLPGIAGDRLLRDAERHEQLLVAAEAAIRPLHEATRQVTRVDDELLRDWVELPLGRLGPAVAGRSRLSGDARAVDRLRGELREVLDGRLLATSRVHGDLCPGNLLMSSDARAVLGIVDWEQGRERGLAQLDLLHLLMTARMQVQRRELGEVVVEMLRDPRWRPEELPAARAVEQRDPSMTARTRSLVLLAWLHHVSANLGKSARYGRSRAWVRRNVDPVLAEVLRESALAPAVTAVPALRGPLAARRATIGPIARENAATIGGLAVAVGLWVVSLGAIEPGAMTDLGLVSVLPVSFFVALLVLTMSFAALVHRRPERALLLTAHLLALIAFLHATPTIVYGTLRYSWAWKHVGIVDYIQRHGSVAPDIHALDVYHNWPAFFGLDSVLTEIAGLGDTLELATWGPVFFNVLNLGAVLFVFSALTRDRRAVWLGGWLFFITCWVGQDYFSPQAFAFFFYLVVLGIVLRWLPRVVHPEGRKRRRLRGWAGRGTRPSEHALRAAMTVLVVLLLAAIAASHALTAVMVTVALTALVLFRICGVRSLPVVALALTAAWDLVFAADYVSEHGGSIPEKIRLPWVTTKSSLTEVARLSQGQALVTSVTRALVVGVAALALAGALRQWRGGGLSRPAVVLALAPLSLFLSGDYDGEILFRIYLFAVPFLAFLAAHALLGPADTRGLARRSALASGVVGSVVLAAFLVAYYGKEHQYYFTPAEVLAARYVSTHAPAGALLIQGTHNYPAQFKNYERLDYVEIAQEPPASRSRVLAHPATVLAEWMSDPSRSGAFVIITRSQKIEVSELGVLPPGSLDRIERALRASPRFAEVFDSRDATVFTLARTTVRRPA